MTAPPGPPPRRPATGRAAWLGLLIAGGVAFLLALAVIVIVAIVAANADTDSERQAIGFFLTAAIPFCGLSVLLTIAGLIVLATTRHR